MKLLPLLLVNLSTVALGLVIYDQLRGDTPTEHVIEGRSSIDETSLEARLRTLEADRAPMLQGPAVNPRLTSRVAQLEATVRALSAAPSKQDNNVPPRDSARAEDAPSSEDSPPTSNGDTAQPTSNEVRAFRKLQEAVRREERIEKNKARIAKALKAIDLNLSFKQREAVHKKYAAFQPRVAEIWNEAKTQARATMEAGGKVDRREIVTTTTAAIRQEFAETLSDVIAHPDAESIAQALMSRGK